MCRILIIQSKQPIQPAELLNNFADMCENNSDWQGDGWGYAWRVESGGWKIEKSLQPIWKDREMFSKFSETREFAVHARGASFPTQKGSISYNQPYLEDGLCFAFNGELSGVRLAVEGEIGAQKIFNLLKKMYEPSDPKDSLARLKNVLRRNAKSLLGMNIAFVDEQGAHVLCDYDVRPEYYGVRYFQDATISAVCSEPIGDYLWKKMEKGEIRSFLIHNS